MTTTMAELTFDRNFAAIPGAAEQVSPLVRRVVCNNPSPFTFKGTSSYIVGRGRVAIIDPGPDDDTHLSALLTAVSGECVTHILVSHRHKDHAPLAAKLKAATGAVVLAAQFSPHRGVAAEHRLDASIDHGFVPDVLMAEGDSIEGPGFRLEAVFTPGHLGDHLCFALPEEKTLFSGDHVMAWATSVIAPPEGSMAHYMASLRRLLDRDDAVYHPGHGPSRPEPQQLVRALIAHRRMREEAIFKRICDGDRTVAAIVRAIYADVDPKLHGAAALSTQAHLEHLIAQGRVRRSEDAYEAVGSR
jgi:glyoxylase-like metal-dependent hydrolase (beta-lactamase superfamily II)